MSKDIAGRRSSESLVRGRTATIILGRIVGNQIPHEGVPTTTSSPTSRPPAPPPPLPQVIRMVGESQEPVGSTVGGGSSGSNKMPTLEEYGTNLTTQVR